MGDAIAIVSVVATASVAVAVALINAYFQARRAQSEGTGHRVEDLRQTIDDALRPSLEATVNLQFTMRA